MRPSPAQTRGPAPVPASVSAIQATTSPKISPKARRLAKQLGADIALVKGTGPSGEILAQDVESASRAKGASDAAASDAVATAKDSGNIEVLTSLGRIMAERTTQSWTTVPHFFVTRDVDATALNAYRERAAVETEREHQLRVTHTDLLIALVSRVLLKHPRLNASWSAEGIRLHSHVNMGIAIAVNDGVVAAVIPNANATTVSEIAIQRRGPKWFHFEIFCVAMLRSVLVLESFAPQISLMPLSRLAIWGCIRWISSARSSRRRKLRFLR